MSDEKNSIPLIDSNVNPQQPPPIAVRKKRPKSTKKCEILKMLVFVVLVILVFVLIAALVIVLLRKCEGGKFTPPKKPQQVEEPIRPNNSFWNSYDLPDTAKPTRYNLTLQLIKEAFNLSQHNSTDYFFGQVSIELTMISRAKFLVLHSKNLTLRSMNIVQAEKSHKTKSVQIIERIYDPFFDQLILVFDQPLMKSKSYVLTFLYSGNISTSESGIIRTFYRNFKLNNVYDILYSKLEPIGARRMFPCFDEPRKKALFTVTVIHNPQYTALSNMPLSKTALINRDSLLVDDGDVSETNSTFTLSIFNQTVIHMSTYLVAFVLVKDFTKLEGERKAGANVAVWGPDGFQDSGSVSLSYSIQSENFLESYFNYSSPLPKTDHIYIPNFLSGAMENWGLITYREKHLLMPPKQGEIFSKKAYMTIAHELAHIWFGNWVTIYDWRDLWLNEGFATYFASYAYFKQLKLSTLNSEEIFLYYHRQILDKDGKASSFPVRLEVLNTKSMFNGFTYSKGQSMLVWLSSIMGEDKFRSGIQAYVKKYAEKNPNTKQFFDVMQKQGLNNPALTTPLKDFFDPWLNKIGYPVLTVNYDIANRQLLVSQKSVVVNTTQNTTWPIYTTYKTDQKPLDQPIFFRQQLFQVNLSLEGNGFVVLNGEGKSYVRVNYSNYLWTNIIDAIKNDNKNINIANKIVLFDDNLYFAYNNLIDISITKSLVDTLANETSIVPWSIFYNKLFVKIYDLFSDDILFVKWSNYVQKLSKNVLNKAKKIDMNGNLNFDDEIYQRQIFLLNCEIDNSEVLELLNKRFEIWLANPKTEQLPKHLATSILYYGIKTNDRRDTWMKVWKIMKGMDATEGFDRDRIAVGLAGTSHPYLLTKLLQSVLTPATHSSDIDKYSFFNNIITWMLQSTNGINVLRKWISNNHQRIKRYAFGDNVPPEQAQTHFEALLSQIASTTSDLNAIRPLLTLHRNKMALTKVVMTNNHWRETVGKTLLKHL